MSEGKEVLNAEKRLPDGEYVVRLIRLSKDGKASVADFTLSRDDKESPLKALSVYAEQKTTPEQALLLMSEDSRKNYASVSRLSVSKIRQLRPEPDSLDVDSLDVVWDPLIDKATGVLDSREGASGHAGITGLERPSGDLAIANSRALYLSLRSQLADYANESLRAI